MRALAPRAGAVSDSAPYPRKRVRVRRNNELTVTFDMISKIPSEIECGGRERGRGGEMVRLCCSELKSHTLKLNHKSFNDIIHFRWAKENPHRIMNGHRITGQMHSPELHWNESEHEDMCPHRLLTASDNRDDMNKSNTI